MGWFIWWAVMTAITWLGISVMLGAVPTTERVSNSEVLWTGLWCGLCWLVIVGIVYFIVN